MRTFHYVPRWQAGDWIKLGWIIAKPNCAMPQFDQYGFTMEWLCDCEMVKPRPASTDSTALNATLRNWLVSRQNRVPETAGEREAV